MNSAFVYIRTTPNYTRIGFAVYEDFVPSVSLIEKKQERSCNIIHTHKPEKKKKTEKWPFHSNEGSKDTLLSKKGKGLTESKTCTRPNGRVLTELSRLRQVREKAQLFHALDTRLPRVQGLLEVAPSDQAPSNLRTKAYPSDPKTSKVSENGSQRLWRDVCFYNSKHIAYNKRASASRRLGRVVDASSFKRRRCFVFNQHTQRMNPIHPFQVQTLATKFAQNLVTQGIKRVYVCLMGLFAYKRSALFGLKQGGIHLSSVVDTTPVKPLITSKLKHTTSLRRASTRKARRTRKSIRRINANIRSAVSKRVATSFPRTKLARSKIQTQKSQPRKIGIAHIQNTLNNTIITVTKKGYTRCWCSSGSVGHTASRRSTNYAAQLAAETVAKKCLSLGMRRLEVRVKGVGYGKPSAIRGLKLGGISVTKIHDVTPIPHNGCRLAKKRRV